MTLCTWAKIDSCMLENKKNKPKGISENEELRDYTAQSSYQRESTGLLAYCSAAPEGLIQITVRHRHRKHAAAQRSSGQQPTVPACTQKMLGFCAGKVIFRGTKSLITQCFKSLMSLAEKQGYQALGSSPNGRSFLHHIRPMQFPSLHMTPLEREHTSPEPVTSPQRPSSQHRLHVTPFPQGWDPLPSYKGYKASNLLYCSTSPAASTAHAMGI